MKRILHNTKSQLLLLLLAVSITQSSCYTMHSVFNTGAKTPVFLHLPNSSAYTYYIEGKQVDAVSTLYSSKVVSSNTSTDYVTGTKTTTTTFEHTYLPALRIRANKPYTTLKVVQNSTGKSQELLLKRGMSNGFKLIMYLQGAFTFGIGNVIDLAGNSTYAWPEIFLNK